MSEDAAPEPVWLSADEQLTWQAVITLLLQLPGRLEAQLQRDCGLTLFEYIALSFLSMAEGRSLRMSDLARLANSSPSRLSNVVGRFEHRGWVRRGPDPDDARVALATLTSAGYEKVAAAAPGHVAAVRRLVIDPLSPAQQRTITEAVDRIRPLLND